MISELNFLPLSQRKDIKLPKVVFVPENNNYAGFYEHKSNTISICENNDYRKISSNLAHEFMHYKQEVEGRLLVNKYRFINSYSEYDKRIKKYFNINLCETEALIYEVKIVGFTETTEYWIKHILGKDFLNR